MGLDNSTIAQKLLGIIDDYSPDAKHFSEIEIRNCVLYELASQLLDNFRESPTEVFTAYLGDIVGTYEMLLKKGEQTKAKRFRIASDFLETIEYLFE